MQIGVLNGIYSDSSADLRNSYPINLIPVPKENGVSKGYLRPADGISLFGTGPGVDRGGINWNGICYRVMGTKLVSIASDGATTTLGDVGGSTQVTLDYSFDRLAICSNGNLFYWDGTTLTQVTDVDLGTSLDVLWVDGYFMSTDGTSLVVTELNAPTDINPLKYGSSEADPDPVKGLFKLRNEVYALNRYTIEVFDNIGGSLFPFQRIEGAQIQKGVLGTHCAAVFVDTIAFLGCGRNEAPAIYLGSNGGAVKISTREIDQILTDYTEAQLASAVMESRISNGLSMLYLHLPDHTLVYDSAASIALKEAVWFVLTSGLSGLFQYRAKNFVWCYDKWLAGDPTSSNHGYLVDTIATHYGSHVRMEFGTMITYNEGRSAIFHELELVCLTGRVAFGLDPTISTSYSVDGVTWSQDKYVKAGMQGDRTKRIVWLQCGFMRNFRIQRFQWDSQTFISVLRLEARLEALSN
jgi:hypothetical protein